MKILINKVEECWENKYTMEDGYVYFPCILGAKVRHIDSDAGSLYSARIRAVCSWHSSDEILFEIYEEDGCYVIDFWGYKYGNRFYSNDRYLRKYTYDVKCLANAILATHALPYRGTRPCEA